MIEMIPKEPEVDATHEDLKPKASDGVFQPMSDEDPESDPEDEEEETFIQIPEGFQWVLEDPVTEPDIEELNNTVNITGEDDFSSLGIPNLS